MRDQVGVVFDDRQTLAEWHVLGYRSNTRPYLDHTVILLNTCCLDKQRKLGWIGQEVLVKVWISLNVRLVVTRHGAPYGSGSRLRLTQEQR